MTIELSPHQERILEAAVNEGRFGSIEEAIDEALQSIALPEKTPQPRKPSLFELFAPLREMDLSDLEFTRNPSTGRPVDFG